MRRGMEVAGALAAEQSRVSELKATATPIRRGPFGFVPKVFDHRGRVWKLARTPLREAFARKIEWADRPKLRDGIRFILIAALVYVILMIATWGLQQAVLPRLGHTQGNALALVAIVRVGAPILLGWLFVAAMVIGAAWLWAPIEAAKTLRRSLCPHCRFSLAGISPDPDRCTVCPECGAAWKLPPPPSNNPA